MKRNSRQREAIIRVLNDTKCHPAADWIYEQVKKEIPNISLGTVYRNLKVMKEEGQILELDLAGDLGRFDGNGQNHYHFRCSQCGRVFDIEEPIDKGLDERVEMKTGYRVSSHRLEFRGLCNDCQVK